MKLINNRNIYKTAFALSFILISIFTMLGIGRVLDYLNTGASRTSMLHLETESEDVYLPKVSWTNLVNPAREMEKNTLGKLERDYLFSWYVKNNALEHNTSKGIADYYTQNTRHNLYQTVNYNKAHGITIENTTLKHFPDLEFYSEDGQLVVFKDRNVIEYQKVYQNKKLLSIVQDTASYQVM
ncbi:MAG: glycosyl hydrolase family 5, partial [Bacteroidetes bacterium]|nr:glycosyl hydrolase family 5 [Bacteroidota bacterium]